jgi:biotin carboxyl carrier protein
MSGRGIILRSGDRDYHVSIEESIVSIDGGTGIPARAVGAEEIRVGSAPGRRAWVSAAGDTRWVFLDGEVFELEIQREGRRPTARGMLGSLSAPMPATVVSIDVARSDRVRKGDPLIILEAMKMELPVRAPADGVVTAVHCKPGELVRPGAPLIELE